MNKRKFRKFVKMALLTLIPLVVLWGLGFFWFLSILPKIALDDERVTADGIVVLTGGSGRIQAGLDKLSKGYGKRLLISGVNQKLSEETILNAIGGNKELADCCIDLGWNATDTRTNAEEAIGWAEDNNFTSILIVTTDYHMPRTILEFEGLSHNITLYPVAVPRGEALPSLLIEYSKYLTRLTRSALTPSES